jgi:Tol biopolymer transport system component/class 3 adenylate cyclase
MPSKYRKTLMGRFPAPSSQVTRIIEAQSPTGPIDDKKFDHRHRAVLFSDIVGSTAYFEKHGDEAGMAMVERHNQLLFPHVEAYSGTIIKTIGDAIMAAYPTAAQAVESATAMQTALKKHNQSKTEAEPIMVRIGINYGTVIIRDDDLFGDVVNAAARVESLASAYMILVSVAVKKELDKKPADAKRPDCIPFDAVLVKGKQEPLEVFEVRWDPSQANAAAGKRPLLGSGDVTGERFEIIGPLGEGGMGQVFKAKDRALDDFVALKFIHGDLASDPESLARFKQEVKLARSVTHKNICRLHEFLQMDGHTFISMELVVGQSLVEEIREKAPFSLEEATRIITAICVGLEEAHRLGIIHRDLKPGNIIIEEKTGRVVITDFGIARLASSQRATQVGLVVGTPEYMSPEQAQGEDVGPAADIYSVGTILYEMLTGDPPHMADTPVAVALKQVNDEPDPPALKNPSISKHVEAIILRCLVKDPAKRFQDAKSLVQALAGQIPTRAIKTASPKTYKLAGLGLLICVAILAAIFLWPTKKQKVTTGPQVLRHLVSSQAVEQAGRWSRDGRFFAFIKDNDVWVSPYPKVKLIRASTGAAAVQTFDLAGLAWSKDGNDLLFPVVDRETSRLVAVPAFGGSLVAVLDGVGAADLSPDGNFLAFAERNILGSYDIYISKPDGSQKEKILAGSESASYLRPRWSPDGKSLALVLHYTGYSSTRDIAVVKVKSKKLKVLTKDGKEKLAHNTDPTWSPDGEWIVYASKRGGTMTIWRIRAKGGDSTFVTQGATEDQRAPDVSPDGNNIIFNTAGRRLDIALHDLSDSRTTPITDDVWADRFPTWSSKAKRIAFRSQRNSDDSSQRKLILLESDLSAEEVIQAPEGIRDFSWCGENRIVYASTVGDDRRLGIIDIEKVKSRVLLDNFYRLWAPTANPDCQTVVFSGQKQHKSSRRLWLVDLLTGVSRELSLTPGFETYPAWSPDGKQIAYRWAPSHERLAESELRVATSDGKNMRTITKNQSFQHSRRRIRWSKDGRFLFYMEAVPSGGRLWKVNVKNSKAKAVTELDDIYTFDFDLIQDDKSLVYSRAIYSGDLFSLENVNW